MVPIYFFFFSPNGAGKANTRLPRWSLVILPNIDHEGKGILLPFLSGSPNDSTFPNQEPSQYDFLPLKLGTRQNGVEFVHIEVNVIIGFGYVLRMRTPVCNKLEHHDAGNGQVIVGVHEIFLHQVLIIGLLFVY